MTFQQVQKYERGVNRISASRLYAIATVLDVPVGFFFDDLPEELAKPPRRVDERISGAFGLDAASRRETVDLVSAYYGIEDLPSRKRFLELMKAMGDACEFGPRRGGSEDAEDDE